MERTHWGGRGSHQCFKHSGLLCSKGLGKKEEALMPQIASHKMFTTCLCHQEQKAFPGASISIYVAGEGEEVMTQLLRRVADGCKVGSAPGGQRSLTRCAERITELQPADFSDV